MRTVLVLTLALPLVVPAAPAVPDDYPMQAQQVADGVYAIVTPSRALPNTQNKGWNSNTGFVVTEAGVLVLDTGTSETIGRAIEAAIAKVTDQPVRWVVISHGHGDHWLGSAAFAGPEVEIIASPAVASRIETEGEEWIRRFDRMTEGATGTSRIVPATTIVSGRTTLVLGDTHVVLMPSGDAHSPGDLVVWLPERRALLAGDVVYSDRMPSTHDANVRQWVAFLEELQALEPTPGVVVAGHGAVTDMQGIERLHGLLSDLWQAVSAGFEAGKAGYEMLPEVRAALAAYEPYYPGLDEKLKRDISHIYLQVERAEFE